MKFNKVLLYFSILFFGSSALSAQQHADFLMPLKTNPALVNYAKQAKAKHFVWRLISDSIVDTLPFLDDFSHGGPYPDTNYWIDNAAYINNTYPICPPTLGVATLDGVNNEGQPYNPNCPPGASYPADSLTSRPIVMSKYIQGDSIWFSFFWQAGGRGMAPLTADTLLLQFRTSHTPWTTIWYHLGYSPVAPDTGFHLVMIPMLNNIPEALDSGGSFNPFDANFQFRFKNYACTSANADQWNIDQVYINRGRRVTDTSLYDISYVYESPSILGTYSRMPWEQFTANDLTDTLYLTGRNNTSSIQQITYHIDIPSALSVPDVTNDVNQFPGYWTTVNLSHIAIKSRFIYAPLSGPTDMRVNQYFKFTGDRIPWNDTLSFTQIFSNYYAYDDSTAEASYFVSGPTPVELAEQITVNNADTLRGLELYFNYMFVNPANYNMRLAVWDNTGAGGSPGNIIFENADSNISTPRTSDTLNGFAYYPFVSSTPIRINAGQTIYVGWIQTNGDSLNIGFDRNTNSQYKIYYNVNTFPGGWQFSSYPGGSIMMHPVFGHVNFHSPLLQAPDVIQPDATIALYPNPATNMISISASMPANTILKVFSSDGRECISNNNFYGNSINTSSLPAGFYIVEMTPQGGQTVYQKLLIQR